MIKLYILIALFYSSCLNGYLSKLLSFFSQLTSKIRFFLLNKAGTENEAYIENDNITIMTDVIDYLPAPNCPVGLSIDFYCKFIILSK